MKKEHMHREILEISVERIVEALDVLGRQGIDAALFGNVIHATVDRADAAMPAIRSALGDANIEVLDITTVRPSLEDVFVSLVEAS